MVTEAVGGGMKWELAVGKCKLLCTEWISKLLLYSTGNYIQYAVTKNNGKKFEKEYIYIYIYIYAHTHIQLIQFAAPETNITL